MSNISWERQQDNYSWFYLTFRAELDIMAELNLNVRSDLTLNLYLNVVLMLPNKVAVDLSKYPSSKIHTVSSPVIRDSLLRIKSSLDSEKSGSGRVVGHSSHGNFYSVIAKN